MNIIFIKAAANDLAQIFDLQQKIWLNTYPNEGEGLSFADIQSRFIGLTTNDKKQRQKRYQSRLTDPDIHFILVKHEKKVVGYCEASKRNREHRIYGIYVSPRYQRQRLGSKLIVDAFEWLGNKKTILLNVASYNEKAINFYHRHGFIKTGKVVQDPAGQLPSGAIIPEIEMKHMI